VTELLRPFLKWAGGKRQLLPEIRILIPSSINTYYEPFIGAGAVLFDLQPQRAVLNDINPDLMNVYQVIKDNIESLISDLHKHRHDQEYFYQVRNLDRDPCCRSMSPVERASRIIFLNKTCFNGLFRVNSKGHFNVPFGHYKNPKILEEKLLRKVHQYLNTARITLLNTDFAKAVQEATQGDFVYFDPPYDPVSNTSSFTSYHLGGFDKNEQERLKLVMDELTARGCKVLLSNSGTDFIKKLYREYQIKTVSANRAINSVASKRGSIDEVLVMNYEP